MFARFYFLRIELQFVTGNTRNLVNASSLLRFPTHVNQGIVRLGYLGPAMTLTTIPCLALCGILASAPNESNSQVMCAWSDCCFVRFAGNWVGYSWLTLFWYCVWLSVPIFYCPSFRNRSIYNSSCWCGGYVKALLWDAMIVFVQFTTHCQGTRWHQSRQKYCCKSLEMCLLVSGCFLCSSGFIFCCCPPTCNIRVSIYVMFTWLCVIFRVI